MRVPAYVLKRLAVLVALFVVAAAILGVVYLRVPEAIGVGRYQASAQFTEGAALYEGAEVTYRGVPIGKVTDLALADKSVDAHMSLKSDVEVPADVSAAIRSRSAVGEQSVELIDPSTPSNSSLKDGDVIPLSRTSQPVEIGPLLDNAYALAKSLDAQDVNTTVTELGKALDGRASDLQTIIDQGGSFLDQAQTNIDPTKRLIRDSGPLLSRVNDEQDHIVSLTENLAKFTTELRKGDDDLRTLLEDGPGFSRELTRLIEDLDQRMPPLLEPLNVVVRVVAIYNRHLDAVLAQYPYDIAIIQAAATDPKADNAARLTLANVSDPAHCTKGFIPAAQWGQQFAKTPTYLPPLVYCTLPHDDPRGVRGARNIPCPNDTSVRTGDARVCLRRGVPH